MMFRWIEPGDSVCRKGFGTVKKNLGLLAVVFAIALAAVGAGGQRAAGKLSATGKAQHSAFSVNAAAERIPNLDLLKKEIKEYHECTCKCGCYARDIDVQADRAIAFLRRRAAHPNSREKLAMVFDIDETSLSNYPEMLKADFAYDSKVFDAWVESAQGPAIAGSLRLYKEAQRLGVEDTVRWLGYVPDADLADWYRSRIAAPICCAVRLPARSASEGICGGAPFRYPDTSVPAETLSTDAPIIPP